jgi:hypothetical protein
MLESQKENQNTTLIRTIIFLRKIIKLHSKGLEGSWELWIQTMTIFNVFNKTLPYE